MSKLIEMPSEKETILVEVETTEDEIVPVSRTGERITQKVEQAFEKVEDIITDSCTVLTHALKKLAEKEPALESASLEFGLQFSGSGQAYIDGEYLGPADVNNEERIAIKEAIHVQHGASGAPAFNRNTGKVVGIVSDKWKGKKGEKQQITFVLPLSHIIAKWEVLKVSFKSVDYDQEDIFNYYDTFVGRKKGHLNNNGAGEIALFCHIP